MARRLCSRYARRVVRCEQGAAALSASVVGRPLAPCGHGISAHAHWRSRRDHRLGRADQGAALAWRCSGTSWRWQPSGSPFAKDSQQARLVPFIFFSSRPAMAEAQPPTELAVKELNTTTGGEAWCAAASAAPYHHSASLTHALLFGVSASRRRCPQVHRGEDRLRKFAEDVAESLAESIRQGR